MRSIKDQLLEAELMSSAPEHVFAWLRRRADAPDEEACGGDDQLEAALLSRNSDLVDLGLAQYGRSVAVVRELFRRDCGKERQEALLLPLPDDPASNRPKALRLAALSNRVFAKRPWWSEALPQSLFGLERHSMNLDPIREFVIAASDDELNALFKNPSVDTGILMRLYWKFEPFDSLSEEEWQRLIKATIGNPRLSTEYVGPDTFGAEPEHDRVFNAAWNLAEKVPITDRWARILESLLSRTVPTALSISDKFAVIQRWRPKPIEEPDAERVKNLSPQDGYLDGFGRLRLTLARLLSGLEIEDLKQHDDVAMRCAFYLYGRPTAKDLMEAHAKEPEFLLCYVINNETVWKMSETREALWEVCLHGKSQTDITALDTFVRRAWHLQRQHPDWFVARES
jgi:hypothetical protein